MRSVIVAIATIEMGLLDYDRDNENEDQILISPSDADRKDHEFKSTVNGPLVDVLNIWAFRRVKNRIFGSIYIVTMQIKNKFIVSFWSHCSDFSSCIKGRAWN